MMRRLAVLSNRPNRAPTIGAAIRFQTSDPAPVAHMIGMKPTTVVVVVMNFG